METTTKTFTSEQFIEEAKVPYLEKNRGFITASKAKLLGKDPWAFNEKYELENEALKEEETPALSTGNAVDYYVSYGEKAFFDRYEILEPRVKRDFSADKIQLTNSDGTPLLEIFKELKRQPLFRLHDPKGIAQHQITGQYETPDGPVKIKGTPDRIFYEEDWIDDTKTVSVKGNQSFERACKANIEEYGYTFSMAFYAILYFLEKGKFPKKLTLSFVGTNGGYKFLQYEIPTEIWHPEVDRIKALLCFYAECKKNNSWPSFQELHQDDVFRHLHCQFYALNPGAIQGAPIPYFSDQY